MSVQLCALRVSGGPVQILDSLDFVGITEHMPLTLIALQEVLGLQAFPSEAHVRTVDQLLWSSRSSSFMLFITPRAKASAMRFLIDLT
jgi:hypothetical protein